MYKEKIEKIIEDNIRPILAMHGGGVELVEIDEKTRDVKIALIGACNGCAIVDITFNNVIEKILKEEIPELGNIEVMQGGIMF